MSAWRRRHGQERGLIGWSPRPGRSTRRGVRRGRPGPGRLERGAGARGPGEGRSAAQAESGRDCSWGGEAPLALAELGLIDGQFVVHPGRGPRADVVRQASACRLEAREPAGVRLGGGGDAVRAEKVARRRSTPPGTAELGLPDSNRDMGQPRRLGPPRLPISTEGLATPRPRSSTSRHVQLDHRHGVGAAVTAAVRLRASRSSPASSRRAASSGSHVLLTRRIAKQLEALVNTASASWRPSLAPRPRRPSPRR